MRAGHDSFAQETVARDRRAGAVIFLANGAVIISFCCASPRSVAPVFFIPYIERGSDPCIVPCPEEKGGVRLRSSSC